MNDFVARAPRKILYGRVLFGQRGAGALHTLDLLLLRLLFEFGCKLAMMTQHLGQPRKEPIVSVTLETEADLCKPAKRMPDPECGSAFIQYCQHVRGSLGFTRYELISLNRAKLRPGSRVGETRAGFDQVTMMLFHIVADLDSYKNV